MYIFQYIVLHVYKPSHDKPILLNAKPPIMFWRRSPPPPPMKLTTGPLILECAILNTVLITYTTLTYLFLDERKYIGGRIHDCLLALKIQIWYFGILQQENVFFKISRTISMPGVVEYIYPIHRCVVNAAAVSRDFLGLFFSF